MRKTVLVTGSSSGIGKEIARILAKDYDVILHYNCLLYTSDAADE